MALIIADRVLETSTTTGSGAYTLAGAVNGDYQAASAVCANGDTFYYYSEGVDTNGNPDGSGWETGLGTWGTGNTLTRTTVRGSSNAGVAVVWAAGTRRIALALTTDFINTLLSKSGGSLTGGLNEARGTVVMNATAMNLWALPNIIDGTGSAVTITAITNAPQAGARRVLYPITGTVITHGATFSVDGAVSYTTLAGDKLEFEAVTTSTYKVHVTKANGTAVVLVSVAAPVFYGFNLSTDTLSLTLDYGRGDYDANAFATFTMLENVSFEVAENNLRIVL